MTFISGLGPISFAACVGFDAGMTLGSFMQAVDISQSTAFLQSQLSQVNEEFAKCPASDAKRLQELDEMRRDLTNRLLQSGREIADANNMLGLGGIGMAAVVGGVCGVLYAAPIP